MSIIVAARSRLVHYGGARWQVSQWRIWTQEGLLIPNQVRDEDGNAHRLYRHFFTDAISESVASGGGFGISNILQQQLSQIPSENNEPKTNL